MSMVHTVLLPEVTTIVMGQSPPGNTYNELGRGLPFFQGKAEFGEVSPTPTKWCSSPKRTAEAGDILMSVRAPVGPTNLASELCCIGRGLAAIRADASRLNGNYLRYFLRHAEPKLVGMGQGSTFAAIGRAEIASLRIPLPSLGEQRRIVDLLSRAEGIVRLRREAQKKAGEIIPALFLDMFGDPVKNPKRWNTTRLADVVEFRGGGTPSKAREDFWTGDLPWVSPKDMKTTVLKDATDHVSRTVLVETNLKLIAAGAVLIVVRGMILVHTVPVALAAVPLTINQDMKALLPRAGLEAQYLLWLLKVLHEHVLGMVSTAAHGTRKLDTDRLECLEIPVPPLDAQRAFARRVESLLSVMALQSTALDAAERTFHSFLGHTFRDGVSVAASSAVEAAVA